MVSRRQFAVFADGCWIWRGQIDRYGYGRLSGQLAHRLMYEQWRKPIPEGHHVHHTCRNRLCVNPAHLEAVTPAEHLRLGPTFQALNAAKTHCKHGHEFTPENTAVFRNAHGGVSRQCRRCRRRRRRQVALAA